MASAGSLVRDDDDDEGRNGRIYMPTNIIHKCSYNSTFSFIKAF